MFNITSGLISSLGGVGNSRTKLPNPATSCNPGSSNPVESSSSSLISTISISIKSFNKCDPRRPSLVSPSAIWSRIGDRMVSEIDEAKFYDRFLSNLNL